MKRKEDITVNVVCATLWIVVVTAVGFLIYGMCNYPKPAVNEDREMAEKFSDVIRNSIDNGDTIVYEMAKQYEVLDDLEKYCYCY